MAFDYTNLYPDTSGNGGYTKSWNYTTVVDNIATCSASGYFNKVATRLGIGDNIVIAVVDAFDKKRTTLVEYATLFVTGIAGGVVTTVNSSASVAGASIAYVDAADALKANIASPTFTGTPTAPTATAGTNTGQLATTAYVDAAAALKANIASPTFTGTPTAPTATAGTNTGQVATTAYVDAADALKANLASPTLTGTPTAPTATVGTNTGQLATTAFVLANVSGSGASPATVAPLMDGAAAIGTSSLYARQDHVHPSDTSRAPLASPTFTGTPASPNVTVDTSTTQIANTAFVIGQAAAATPLINGAAAVGTSTRFARGDHVHPTDTTRAPLVSPAFTTPSLGAATATTINGAAIDNAVWSQTTPTPVPVGGAFTTATAIVRQKVIGKTVFIWAQVSISAVGTATSGFSVTIPTATLNTSPMGAINNNTGANFSAYVSGSTLTFSISPASNTYFAAGSYESA